MTYLPHFARVPHPPNKFRHHLKIGILRSMVARTPPLSPQPQLIPPEILVTSKCIPILLCGLEVCELNKPKWRHWTLLLTNFYRASAH